MKDIGRTRELAIGSQHAEHLRLMIRSDSRFTKRPRETALAVFLWTERAACFLRHCVRAAAWTFQFLLAIGKESINLAVRFVADSVNLRTKLSPRSCRILIEQRLDHIVVLLKQRPDLVLLFRSQSNIFRKASKFLVDRLGRMDLLKLLTR
jgi:hypothetical protein